MYRLQDGSVRFAGLCRREPAWELQVEFERGPAERQKVQFRVRP